MAMDLMDLIGPHGHCLVIGPHGHGRDRTWTAWLIEEEHLLDRFYRGEDKTVQDIASRPKRSELATRCRLTLLYFGREGGTESQQDPKPWRDADDAQLKDLYDSARDRDVIFKELGRKPWWVASRLLEIIARSQLSLTKAHAIGTCLDRRRPKRSIMEIVLERSLATSGRISSPWGYFLSQMPSWKVLPRASESSTARLPPDWFPSRVAICSLGLLWDDELRGLCQIVLAPRQPPRAPEARSVPGVVARLILAFLVLPL